MSGSKEEDFSIDTGCVHAGEQAQPAKMGLNTPVVGATAFDYRLEGVRYPRYVNTLNHEVTAGKIAALEGAQTALVTASGMGALSAMFLSLMKPGDHAVILDGLYGGTTDLIEGLLQPLGMHFSTWNGKTETLAGLCRDDTRVLLVESPTNPMLQLIDMPAVARIASEHGMVSVIDSTFATPVNQRPIEHGFDLVMHSGTKYLGGHSDLLCGALAGSKDLIDRIRTNVVRLGATLNGADLAVLERSLKTLSVRVRQQTANAEQLAERLNDHGQVEAVFHPGLRDHPGHELAARQMDGFGAMLSFRLGPSLDADSFLDALGLIRPAVSLGGVESTICQPSRTSHAKLAPEQREALGIDDRLMRLSVGIESVDDLWDDLETALGAL